MSEIVTVLRRARTRDPRTGDWVTDPVQRIDVRGCIVAPRFIAGGQDPSAALDSKERQGVLVGLTVYMPAGTDINRSDEVEVRGQRYTVEGEPFLWVSLSGRHRRINVPLQRVEG